MATIQKISPCLWYDNQAEEAAKYYVSVFKGKLGTITRYDEEGAKVSGRPAGSVMTVSFTLRGQEFLALNGGPLFKLSEAVSFMIYCKDQKEIDYFWSKLAAEEQPCGWMKDKFGLSWQVVPKNWEKMAKGKNGKKTFAALMQMKKPILSELEKASKGK